MSLTKNPEYSAFRCCMCPNQNNPQSAVCPAGGPQNKPKTQCRFVLTYIDIRGQFVSVTSGLLKTESGKTVWFTGRSIQLNAPAHKVKSPALPARENFDQAQSDLNIYARKKGWFAIKGQNVEGVY